ncbi:MAG: hypothetical protein KDA87_25165 [Planctomycetales bacterium]|nr:hypothetical protein [Planctomycetales bacterium]
MEELAARYKTIAFEQFDLNDIQEWCLGKVHFPFDQLPANAAAQIRNEDWIVQSMYALMLHDSEFLNIADNQTRELLNNAMQHLLGHDGKTPFTRRHVVQLWQKAHAARQQFSVATPPALWSVWFKTVHADWIQDFTDQLLGTEEASSSARMQAE